jgi:DNA replication protein DnaC
VTDEPRPVLSGDAAAELVRGLRRGLKDPGEGDELVPAEPIDAEELERVRRAGVDELRAARWHATCPQRFHRATLDWIAEEHGQQVVDDLLEWSHHPQGRNLVLLGPVGTGKTAAALLAVKPHHAAGLDVRFLPVVELLDQLRPGGPEGALYDLADVDRLVVDDLGSEKPTEWTAERLYALLNRRWLEELPTIATANLAPNDLEEALGPRTFSRLVGSDAVVLRLAGHDRRRRKP